MKLYLDSASPTELAKVRRLGFNVTGVTINPTLLIKAGFTPETAVRQFKDMPTFMQVCGDTTAGILATAVKYHEINPNLVVKLDATTPGLAAMPHVIHAHIPVAATLVYEPAQAILADQAGAHDI